ncbi:MAG: hypothetical protein K5799_14840 [Erythrobacter sp.]|nr:hypothetical protein [Erythrobacter sp.]
MIIVGSRMESRIVVEFVVLSRASEATTEVRQDKKPHIAGLSVSCFDRYFPDFLHIAPLLREVRAFILSRDFSGNRTSQVLAP